MENSTENKDLEVKTVAELEKQLETQQKELVAVMELLQKMVEDNKKLTKRLAEYEKEKDEYQDSWTWVSKITYLIKNAGKPLRSLEIIALLSEREVVLETKKSKEQFVSAFLNTAVKHGRIVQWKLKGVRGFYYCLPEWVDEKGELLREMKLKIY